MLYSLTVQGVCNSTAVPSAGMAKSGNARRFKPNNETTVHISKLISQFPIPSGNGEDRVSEQNKGVV